MEVKKKISKKLKYNKIKGGKNIKKKINYIQPAPLNRNPPYFGALAESGELGATVIVGNNLSFLDFHSWRSFSIDFTWYSKNLDFSSLTL